MPYGLSYVPDHGGRQMVGSLDEHSLEAAAMSICWPQGTAPFLPSLCSFPSQHILYCIVDSECKSRDVLQSYFDLLGELMKFNVDAFKRFNRYINTDAKVRLNLGLWEVWFLLVVIWRILGCQWV